MSTLSGSRGTRSFAPARLIMVALVVTVALTPGAGTARADQPVSFDGPDGAAQISLIGDSTLTGVRWYDDYGDLRQYDFLLNAESCRRTIGQSCISREGYRSETVLAAMNTHYGDLGEVLVVMSGYNDPDWTIEDSISLVTGEARSQGVENVVWLTLRTTGDVDYSDPQEGSSTSTFRLYNETLTTAAATSGGYLQVADWATYSAGSTGWFEADGVHLTPAGVDALTSYLADVVGQVLSGEDVSPWSAPWTVLVPGAEGQMVADVQSALVAAGIEVPGGADGIYGNSTMAAVASYQEQSGDLQVTGAVDDATARALGVHPDSAAEAVGEPEAGEQETAGAEVAPVSAASGEADADATARTTTWWPLALVVVFVLMVAALVVRRRYVVVQRRHRRRARVHPATSPHRSVADLRRSGALPPVGPVSGVEATPLVDQGHDADGIVHARTDPDQVDPTTAVT